MKLSNISKPTLILVLVVAILSGLFGATAATTIYNSSLVSYNNAASGMQSNNVQDAVDELYHAATDYSGFDNRITKLESYAQDNPTSYFREYGIELNRANGGTTTGGYIDFHWQGDTSDYTSRIIEEANGVLNLRGTAIKANGRNFLNEIDSLSSSLNTTNTNVTNVTNYFNSMNVAGLSSYSPSLTMYHMTASIRSQVLRYKIVGNTLIITGRIVVDVTSRSNSNPGVYIILPNSKKVKQTFAVEVAQCASTDGTFTGETTTLSGSADATQILVNTTETVHNVPNGKTINYVIPPTYIPIK